MTKQELLKLLAVLKKHHDKERAHGEADEALLDFINDEEIRGAFNDIDKWYA